MARVKNALGLLALVLIAAACWLIFAGGGQPAAETPEVASAAIDRPEAGSLGSGIADMRRDEALDGNPILGGAATVVRAGPLNDPEPVAWFRGQLSVVSGELPNPPSLMARPGAAAPGQHQEERIVPMRAGELSFEVSTSNANCQVRFAMIIRPVRAIGGTLLEDGWIEFNSPNEALIVEVEIMPHAAVIFLRDPDGAPLAGGIAWSKVTAVESASSTFSAILGDDGLLIFDYGLLEKVPGADTVTFGVRRPPDIGSSEGAPFSIQDFLALPRPVVLRFPASARLRFHILDPARQPIVGATVRLGHLSENPPSGADGWAETPQSSPPADSVIVEAKGFVRETAPITLAAQQEGQEIEMRPSSSIRIVAEESPRQGWGGMKVMVDFDGQADGSALLPSRFEPGRFTECGGSTSYNSSPDQLEFALETGFSEAGQAILDGIHSDVPAHLRIYWNDLLLLDERVALRPGDGEHVVRLGPLPRRADLHGVILDPAGLPVSGAQVRLGGASWSGHTTTGPDGSFDLGEAVSGSTVRIRVSAPGWAPLEVEHQVEEGDSDSAGTLRLETGRSMVLIVLAPDGRHFVPLADSIAADFRPVLQVYDEWFEPVQTDPGAGSPGTWRFENLPLGQFECRLRFRWNIAGDERSVDTLAGSCTITLTAQEFDMLNTPQ
jgi:hypothetical protein